MKEVTFQELEQWRIEGKKFRLVDVRTPAEHKNFNIGGELIPLDAVLDPKWKWSSKEPVVFYCRKGIRSAIAIQRLQQDYPQCLFYNLTGGIG